MSQDFDQKARKNELAVEVAKARIQEALSAVISSLDELVEILENQAEKIRKEKAKINLDM